MPGNAGGNDHNAMVMNGLLGSQNRRKGSHIRDTSQRQACHRADAVAFGCGCQDAKMNARSLRTRAVHTMASPTLKTPRLILRTIIPDDRDAIVAILSDKVAMQHMHYRAWDARQRQGWVDTALEIAGQAKPDGIGWVIERKDTGETIGWFGISNPADPATALEVNFGYALGRAHWNQGYMTEVLQRVFAHEFDTLGVPQLTANCDPSNVGSARAMEKAGMRYTHSSIGPDMEGRWQEQDHYRITGDEWNGLSKEVS